jgi:molybdate transport system ATP-binding protein
VQFASDAKVTALVGPSGSGKTSLVESIAGLRRATGRIVVDSASLMEMAPEQRRVGYVPQDAALFPHLSVRENILFGGRDPSRAGSLGEILELTALLDRSPSTLSGGERQRVAIARALMTNPRLLLLDEPLAAIDQPLRERILMFLRRVRDLGVPMIYVTHQPFEAIALSSWCIVLEKGRVVAKGHPRDVLARDPILGSLENVFEVANPRHDRSKGITRVTTAEGMELVLPFDRVADAAFPLVVRIGAEEIVVFGERPGAISSRNLIEGSVNAIRESDGIVDIVVAAASPIRIRITRSAADELRLALGSRVWLALRSRSFRIVG